MQNQDLTPIAIPPKQRWHDFRVAYLPPVTFGALLVVIYWMWTGYVQPSAIIGEVETLHADVISIVPGMIQELRVDRLQTVTSGQVLAVVAPLDPEQLEAEIAAAEADLRLLKARMDLDKTRNLNSYAQLRVDLAEEKLVLELARISLLQAEGEYERTKKLFDDQLIARGTGSTRDNTGLDVALRDRDSLRVEVASREKTVTNLEASIKRLEENGAIDLKPADTAVEQAIAAQRERIERLQKPFVLRSPIDGFISDINHRAGERVDAGQAIVVVSGRKSDRILAWVHPPVTQAPRIGDIVEVRRMGLGGMIFEGTIVQVGSQLEPVSPMLRTPTANPERIEVGLPLLVQSVRALELTPGEAVQLRVIRSAPNAAAN